MCLFPQIISCMAPHLNDSVFSLGFIWIFPSLTFACGHPGTHNVRQERMQQTEVLLWVWCVKEEICISELWKPWSCIRWAPHERQVFVLVALHCLLRWKGKKKRQFQFKRLAPFHANTTCTHFSLIPVFSPDQIAQHQEGRRPSVGSNGPKGMKQFTTKHESIMQYLISK